MRMLPAGIQRTFPSLLIASMLFASVLAHAAPPAATTPAEPPKAARSVHLSYITPACVSFYAEVNVQKSVPGSYFEVCGFAGGYFGIQELTNGTKVGIFSVWDVGDTAKTDNPNAVAGKDQVQVLHQGKGVRVSRFGGEGTGAHSDFDFDWKIGHDYRFFLASQITDGRTAYSAFIYDPQKSAWFHIATFSAPNGGREMTGLYSFIEDFRRDTRSATQVRRALFGNQWIQTPGGNWTEVTSARFTASGATWEAKDSINAGTIKDHFFLQTGGDTKMEHALGEILQRASAKPPATQRSRP